MAEGPSGQSPRGPGRKLSLDSVAIYSSPSLPSSLGTPHTHLARKLDEDSGDLRFSNLGVEQKLTLLLKIVEDQMTEKDLFIQSRLKSMDDKLGQLLSMHEKPPEKQVIRRRASLFGRQMSMVSKKASKQETPSNSKEATDFDDMDQKLGLRVMKAAKRRDQGIGPVYGRTLSQNVLSGGERESVKKKEGSRQGSRELQERLSGEGKNLSPARKVKAVSYNVGAVFDLPPGPPPSPQKSLLKPVEKEPSGVCPVLPNSPDLGGDSQKVHQILAVPPSASTRSGAATIAVPAAQASSETKRKANSSIAGGASGEASLSHLFRHRENQLTPRMSAEQPELSDEPTASVIEEDSSVQALPSKPYIPLWLRLWLLACDLGTRLCGLSPLVQCRAAQVENGTALTIVTEPEQEENAAWVSKIYNSLLLTLLFSLMALAGPGQYFYNEEAAFSGSFTVTDMGVALGAWLAVWSCGGVYSYFKSARIQLQMNDHLAREVETSGFEQHWMMQKGKDSLSIFLLWLVTFGSRMALALRTDLDPFGELKLALYALASACILSACYTQISMWRGISLAIVAYARSVLEGEMNCREARGKWREVISCMRQTSRMYQLTAASCGLTTVLVCFGALYDLSNRSGLAILDALPSLVIGLSLVGALYVAASATAHCTRLPSLVSMLDGDEELEHEYINLALFLSLSESGFFMWDTRVNLAVLQKFLYFTMAIVGTIGFQLKVFHFNAT